MGYTEIGNSILFSDYNLLKKILLLNCFTIHHLLGIWHRGPDAVSCHPVHQIIPSHDLPMQKDLNHAYAIENKKKQVISQSLGLINEPNATPYPTIANIEDPVIKTSQIQNH